MEGGERERGNEARGRGLGRGTASVRHGPPLFLSSLFLVSHTLPTSSHRSTQYSGLTVPSSQVSSSSAANCVCGGERERGERGRADSPPNRDPCGAPAPSFVPPAPARGRPLRLPPAPLARPARVHAPPRDDGGIVRALPFPLSPLALTGSVVRPRGATGPPPPPRAGRTARGPATARRARAPIRADAWRPDMVCVCEGARRGAELFSAEKSSEGSRGECVFFSLSLSPSVHSVHLAPPLTSRVARGGGLRA